MQRDHGISETVSVILIIGMVLILAIVIAVFVLGANIIPQNTAYMSVDMQKIPVSGTEVISIFNRAGDAVSLKKITDTQKYAVSFYVDTPSGSYRVQPPSDVDTFKPGTTLFVYNTPTGLYKITNNPADFVSAPLPVNLTSVRIIDEKSHQLIAQWKNSTGFSSGGNTVLPPTFTGIDPNSGSTLGGTSVTIVGTNFVPGGSFGVTIGGVDAAAVFDDATSITATTPPGTAGAQSVVITNNDGQTATGTYTYMIPITSITITGTPQVDSVLMAGSLLPLTATASYQWQISTTQGGSTFTNIAGQTSTSYTPVLGDVGYNIRVVATGTGKYTGIVSATAGPVQSTPTITSLSKTTGRQGKTVTNIRISGANYITSPAPTVTFTRVGANTLTATVTAVTTTRVTVTLVIPSGQPIGLYSVTVRNSDGGTATRANSFTITT
jgi:hypothetical protein